MRRFLDNPLGLSLTAMWVVTGIVLMIAIAWPDLVIRVSAAVAAAIALATHAIALGPAERRARRPIDRLAAGLGTEVDAPLGRLAPESVERLAARAARLTDTLDAERSRRVAMERSVRTLLDAVPSPLLLVDLSGHVILCNAEAGNLVGRDPEAVPGRMLDEVLPRAEVLALHQSAARGQTARARARLEASGGIATFEVAAMPAHGGTLGPGEDREPGPIRRSAVTPAQPGDIARDRTGLRAGVRAGTGAGAEPDVEADLGPDLETQDKPRAPADTGSPGGAPGALDEAHDAVLLSFIDVTELATAVELKTDFVANASHELRTPVASISAALDSLAGPTIPEPAVHERVIKIARNNLVRLQELIRDLLDLARLESPNVSLRTSSIAVDAVRDRMQARFEELFAERRVGLEFEIEPGLDRLETDSGLLDLVLANLIDNASKFAFEQTAVRVIMERAVSDGARDDLSLRVIDRGIGIPLNQQQRIFERFYQIDEARSGNAPRRGTGLGLAIVKHATRTLDGQITVHSVWQEGTTMSVVIPNAVPRPARDGPVGVDPAEELEATGVFDTPDAADSPAEDPVRHPIQDPVQSPGQDPGQDPGPSPDLGPALAPGQHPAESPRVTERRPKNSPRAGVAARRGTASE